MKKILLPTDFSEQSFQAIVYALQLFEGAGFELCLLHVYSVPSSVGVLISVDKILEEEVMEKMRKEERRVMEHLGYPQVKINKIAMAGIFHELMQEVVNTHAIDLLVMGTKGATGVASSVFGTHTSRLISEVSCPVLVLPSDVYFQGISSVVFAEDHENSKEEVNGQWFWVDWIIEHHQPTFTQLHIEDPDKLEEAPEMIKLPAEKAMKPLPAVVVCHDSKEVAYHEDVTEGISEYVIKNKADVVVLVAQQRGWLDRLFHQSVTQELSKRNLAPLLIFHD